MLNISNNNRIGETIEKYSTFKTLTDRPHYKILNKIIVGVSLFGLLILFLPWTQNISGSGAVTTLKPDQRPQTIHSAIAGRIEKWYVKEGDFVQKGDTILFISETKEDYLDPNLVKNTILLTAPRPFFSSKYRQMLWPAKIASDACNEVNCLSFLLWKKSLR